MWKSTLRSTTFALVGALALAPAARADDEKNIVETAVSAGSFQTLVAAVKAAGLVETLSGEGPFTVFAPTDDAFAKLPEGTVETLLRPENKEKLVAILTYHVVPGRVAAKDVLKLSGAKSVQGEKIDFTKKGKDVTVDGAKVVKADIEASNGMIHVIDAVILPSDKNVVQTAASTETFKTLVAAVKAAGLVDTLSGKGPFTVFAPTDEAFAKLPKGTVESLLEPENLDDLRAILTYHVVPGRIYSLDLDEGTTEAKTVSGAPLEVVVCGKNVKIGKAKVVAADIDATNGVIHVVNHVLLPPEVEAK